MADMNPRKPANSRAATGTQKDSPDIFRVHSFFENNIKRLQSNADLMNNSKADIKSVIDKVIEGDLAGAENLLQNAAQKKLALAQYKLKKLRSESLDRGIQLDYIQELMQKGMFTDALIESENQISTMESIKNTGSNPRQEKDTIPTESRQDPVTIPELKPVIPMIKRLIERHESPLDHLQDFLEYLELEGYTLSPEMKKEVERTITDIIENKRKMKRKDDLIAKLFGEDHPARLQSSAEKGTFPIQNPTGPAQNPAIKFSNTPVSQNTVIPSPTVIPDTKCQVCLSEFSTSEPGAVKCPHCGNEFHYRCITKWVNKHGTCPVCKKELKV